MEKQIHNRNMVMAIITGMNSLKPGERKSAAASFPGIRAGNLKRLGNEILSPVAGY